MKRKEFRSLILHLEALARQSPLAYKIRVFGMALLGYAYILGILLVLLTLLIGIAVIAITIVVEGKSGAAAMNLIFHLAIPLGLLIWIVLRALWVSVPPPEGRPLEPHEAPALYALVRELQQRLQTPVIHDIHLTPEFNAGILQWPRLGMFGWHRNYLLIGLPLFASLTPDRFRAVLAHEFGHLSGHHSSFSLWVFRLRATWGGLMDSLQQANSWGTFLFSRFINWFAPLFDAYAFVIGREHEYQADRLSGQESGPGVSAQALIATDLTARHLEHAFWPEVNQPHPGQEHPPDQVFTHLQQFCHSAPSRENADQWLKETLNIPTDLLDTHPALCDRLQSLGYPPGEVTLDTFPPLFLSAGEPSALEAFLGSNAAQILREFDEFWLQQATPGWVQARTASGEELRELEELETRAKQGPLPRDDQWKLVCYTGKHRGNEVGKTLLRDFLATYPDHIPAHNTLGILLLSDNDPQGEHHLRKVLDGDPESYIPTCMMLSAFWRAQGNATRAEEFLEMAEHHEEQLNLANSERVTLSVTDQFSPHGLPEDQYAHLLAIVEPMAEIRELYLVRKNVALFPAFPSFIIGLVIERSWWNRATGSVHALDMQVIDTLIPQVRLQGSFLVASLTDDLKPLIPVFQALEGSRLFQRKEPG